jgi:glycosyltransferase involved in cell wall biosynthesis
MPADAAAGPRRPAVLFICPDAVGERMAGLGIRHVELARALAPYADVTVASGSPDSTPVGDVATTRYDVHAPHALRALIARADAVIAPPQWPLVSRWLRTCDARVIHDVYTPEALETAQLFAGRPAPVRRLMVSWALDRLHDALSSAHHLICASEKQRDLWIGALLATRRIDPARCDRDPGLRETIDAVPFGTPTRPPRRSGGPGIRGRLAQIGPDDEIVLWNGGIWRWLDAPTAVRAVALLAERRPGVRLVFMGASAAAQAASRRAAEEAEGVARQLGALDRTVLFHRDWVPYGERVDWLLDADCALSTHSDSLESRYAFRTRLLDCFWAGLPIVATAGDDLAARVSADGLGELAEPGDVAGTAAAIERVLDRGRGAYAAPLAAASTAYAWPVAARALVRWIGSDEPPRERLAPRAAVARTPGHRLRAAAYLAGRPAIARLGLRSPAG